jgi:Glycosyl transferase family 2
MQIDLYSIAWNERRMLSFFLDYYGPWVDRFVIFDDQSDDGTAETLARHPKVDLRRFPPKGSSFVLAALEIWQHAWKESRGRADWVIVTNIDEFIYHSDGVRGYLERCTAQGITMIHPRGFEMVGERFPNPGQSLVETVRKGVAMFGQDKRQVFDPDAVSEMRFGPGRHECRPMGTVVEPSPVEASLLHYKYVDALGYLLRRQRSLARRMLEGDRRSGFGAQYHLTPEALLRSYEWLQLHAYDVVRPG